MIVNFCFKNLLFSLILTYPHKTSFEGGSYILPSALRGLQVEVIGVARQESQLTHCIHSHGSWTYLARLKNLNFLFLWLCSNEKVDNYLNTCST